MEFHLNCTEKITATPWVDSQYPSLIYVALTNDGIEYHHRDMCCWALELEGFGRVSYSFSGSDCFDGLFWAGFGVIFLLISHV